MSNVRKSVVDEKGAVNFISAGTMKELLISFSTLNAIEGKELESVIKSETEEKLDNTFDNSAPLVSEKYMGNPIVSAMSVMSKQDVTKPMESAPIEPINQNIEMPVIDDLNLSSNIKEEVVNESKEIENVINNEVNEIKLETPQTFEFEEKKKEEVVEEPIKNEMDKLDPYVSLEVVLEKDREYIKSQIDKLNKEVGVILDELSRSIEKLRAEHQKVSVPTFNNDEIKSAIEANLEEIRNYSSSNNSMSR